MVSLTVRSPPASVLESTVAVGAARPAAGAGPTASRPAGSTGKSVLSSAWPVTYWRVHGPGDDSRLTHRAVPVSASSAYMRWVGIGWSASHRSTLSPTPVNMSPSTNAT